jgi:hypothetical protein
MKEVRPESGVLLLYCKNQNQNVSIDCPKYNVTSVAEI